MRREAGVVDGRDVLTISEVVERSGFAASAIRYYEAEGRRHARDRRGMITRPTLDEVLSGGLSPAAAADEILARLKGQPPR